MEDYIMNRTWEIEALVKQLKKEGKLIPAKQTGKVYKVDRAIGTMLKTAIKSNYNEEEGYYESVTFHDDDDTYRINLSDSTRYSADITDIIKKIDGNSDRNSNIANNMKHNTSNGYYSIWLKVSGRTVAITLHTLICCMTCGENNEVFKALSQYKYAGGHSLELNHTCVAAYTDTLRPVKAAAAIAHPHYIELTSVKENNAHRKNVLTYKRYLANNITLRNVTYKDSIILYGMINSAEQENRGTDYINTLIDNYYRRTDREPEVQFV